MAMSQSHPGLIAAGICQLCLTCYMGRRRSGIHWNYGRRSRESSVLNGPRDKARTIPRECYLHSQCCVHHNIGPLQRRPSFRRKWNCSFALCHCNSEFGNSRNRITFERRHDVWNSWACCGVYLYFLESAEEYVSSATDPRTAC